MVSFELISHLNPDLMLLHPNMIKRKLTIIPCVLIDKQRKDSIIKIGLNFLSSSDLQEVFPFVSMLRAGFTTFKTRIDSNLKIDSNIASIAFISYGDIEDVSSGLSTVTGQKRQSALKEDKMNTVNSKTINEEVVTITKSDIKAILERLDNQIMQTNEIRENTKILKLIANKLEIKLPNNKGQTKRKTEDKNSINKNTMVKSINSTDKLKPATRSKFFPCINSSKSFLNTQQKNDLKGKTQSKDQSSFKK